MAALQSKTSKNLKSDYQFRKSGLILPAPNYPWNPLIQKPQNIPDNLHKKGNYKTIIKKITTTYGDLIDNPIEIIKRINESNKYELTETRKALYFKALYQETPLYFSNIKLTYDYMYKKYFFSGKLENYTASEKILISKCINNKTPLIELYKKEYLKYSKWF